MALTRGRHSLRHGSALQQAIGLSSGEAEYYALTKGASYGLGTQAFFEDWDLQLALRVHSDSSSAKAFAKRLGLGRQRHVQTRFLWLQERVRRRHLSVLHIEGKKNPADLFTKALTRNEIIMHSEKLGSKFYDKDDDVETSMQSLRVSSPWAASSRCGPRGGKDEEEETPQRGQTPRGHVSRRSPRGEQIAPLSEDEEKPTKAREGSHSLKTAEKEEKPTKAREGSHSLKTAEKEGRGDAEALFSMAGNDDDGGCFSGQPLGRSRGMIREVGSRGMLREGRLEESLRSTSGCGTRCYGGCGAFYGADLCRRGRTGAAPPTKSAAACFDIDSSVSPSWLEKTHERVLNRHSDSQWYQHICDHRNNQGRNADMPNSLQKHL